MLRKSLVEYRWGRRRAPAALVRVSVSTRRILDGVPEKYRRDFIDRAVRAFLASDWYVSKMQNC